MDAQILESLLLNISLFASLFATVFYGLGLIKNKKSTSFKLIAGVSFCITLLSILSILIARAIYSGHAPLSNFFESFIFAIFFFMLIYILLERYYKTGILGVCMCSGVLLLLLTANNLPARLKGISALMPALQSEWLYIHVSIAMISYSIFALSFITSIIFLVFYKSKKEVILEMPKDKTLKLFDEITYRLVLAGITALAAGIITGSMWADKAWGNYWSWDPKEVWALITWMFYVTIVHTRRAYPLKKELTAVLSVIGIIIIIVTYYGVNYLSNSLHSYGL